MQNSLDRLLDHDRKITVRQNSLHFGPYSADELLQVYGSPLYLYSEATLRSTCRRLKAMLSYPNHAINYSVKANNNIPLLKIIHEEGFQVDAMSPGEMFLEEKAGFKPEEILFISNNSPLSEFQYAVEKGITISVDSLSQLERFGKHYPGHKAAVRINPGKGAGHHEKVVTAGEKSKFGIPTEHIADIHTISKAYNLTIFGLTMHIGSNYLESETFLETAKILLDAAMGFPQLEFIDVGGGFGVPYKPDEGVLDLKKLGQDLDRLFENWANKYGRKIRFILEPGRFVTAQSGIFLTRVESIKINPTRSFVGTDGGFNLLIRPMVYGSYHEIVNCSFVKGETKTVDISGNICESGDLFAKNRPLSITREGDVLAILDAGAYGYSMASNYNARLRPAEILLHENGEVSLIRRRDTLEDLIRNQVLDPIRAAREEVVIGAK